MLIIEGSDLVGKTTLCKALLKHPWMQSRGYIYRHFSRLPSGFDYIRDYMWNASRRSVQDRYHMSEIAYSVARGDTSSPLTPEKYRLVDGYLRGMGSYTVVLTTDAATIERRFKERGDDMYDFEVVRNANYAFLRMMEQYAFQAFGVTYVKDCDQHLHIKDGEITKEHVNYIIDAYLARQMVCLDTTSGRNNNLYDHV